MKPIILAAGIKSFIVAKKIALASKALALAGQAAYLKGRVLSGGAAKLSSAHLKIIGLGALAKAKIAGAFVLPKLKFPLLKKKAYTKSYGPSYGYLTYALNTPVTGYKFGKASLVGNRKKRDSEEDEETSSQEQQRPMVHDLITLVNSRNAQQCLAKVICELSANKNQFGPEGVKFSNSLQRMSETEHPSAPQFRAASVVGLHSLNPSVCSTQFDGCSAPSEEVVRVGNLILG